MKHLLAMIYAAILIAMTISLGLVILFTAFLFGACVYIGERCGAFKRRLHNLIT